MPPKAFRRLYFDEDDNPLLRECINVVNSLILRRGAGYGGRFRDPFTFYQHILDNIHYLKPRMKLFRDYFISEHRRFYNRCHPLERRSFVQNLGHLSRKYNFGFASTAKENIEQFITQMFILIFRRKVSENFTLADSKVTRPRIHLTLKKIGRYFFDQFMYIEQDLIRRHEIYVDRMRRRLQYQENRNRYLSIRNRITTNRLRRAEQHSAVSNIVQVGRRLGLEMSGVRFPLPAHMGEMEVEEVMPTPVELNPVPRGMTDALSSQVVSNLAEIVNPNYVFPESLANRIDELQRVRPSRVEEVDDEAPADIVSMDIASRAEAARGRRFIYPVPMQTQRRLARRRPREEPLLSAFEPYVTGVPGAWRNRRQYRGPGWNIRRITDIGNVEQQSSGDRPIFDDPDIENL